MNQTIATAVEEGNLYEIEELVNGALASGEAPKELLEAMMAGLKACGDRFEKGEYFLPELMGAGDAFKAGMGVLGPRLRVGDQVSQGKVVLGTVHGDVHDIGKNLVGFMLSSAGFTVVDIGVDVSTEGFVRAVREHEPQVLGMSALLTTTMLGMEDVIKALRKAGLRDKVKVLIGGGPVSKKYAEDIGADAYGNDAAQAVNLVKGLL
ncbi:MAG TPA: corrinoid protein [Anaerolineae bacterium]|nr:corrinoid protein [Anaerolineae bacterium]